MRVVAAVSALTCALALLGGAATAQTEGDGEAAPTVGVSEAVVAEAQAAFDAARLRTTEARDRLAALEAEAGAIDAERSGLDQGQQELSLRLQQAEVRARDAMVAAYISGRPVDLTAVLLTTTSATDLLVRTEMLTDHVAQRTSTVEEYVALRDALDGAAADVAARAAANEMALATARAELASAEIEEREAERLVTVVASQIQLEAERRAGGWGRPYKGAGSDGSPTPEQSGNAKGLAWDMLRWCESGGNYAAVSPTGAFRGAYQFHMTTWHMLGGGGDPIDATTAEQDFRAQVLYDMLGAKPWPQCGRYLKMSPEQLLAAAGGAPPPEAPTVPTVLPSEELSALAAAASSTTSSSSTTSTVDPSSSSSTATTSTTDGGRAGR